MPLVSRKGLLALATVVDIAVSGRLRPVSARVLAARHGLPPRHLEPVLQALVQVGILKGIRGPHGGYELARAEHAISAEDILLAASSAEQAAKPRLSGPALIDDVVAPALANIECVLSSALARINVEDMMRHVKALN